MQRTIMVSLSILFSLLSLSIFLRLKKQLLPYITIRLLDKKFPRAVESVFQVVTFNETLVLWFHEKIFLDFSTHFTLVIILFYKFFLWFYLKLRMTFFAVKIHDKIFNILSTLRRKFVNVPSLRTIKAAGDRGSLDDSWRS